MLTRLRVRGFKNLVDVDVRFGPFTCIAGPNGAGKSNLFDAIRFLGALSESSLTEAALAVRSGDESVARIRELFHRSGNEHTPTMSFDAEMVIPQTGTDRLGQMIEARHTFVRYALELRYREDNEAGPLEVVRESLEPIKISEAGRHLPFPHDTQQWRKQVVSRQRPGGVFLSTEGEGANRTICIHQEGTSGRKAKRLAGLLPRTVLSDLSAENPTGALAREEMRSWQLLQLEPSSLRQSSRFTDPRHLSARGDFLPATLFHLAKGHVNPDGERDPERLYCQIANQVVRLIPDVRAIRVDQDDAAERFVLTLTSRDGTTHQARALSDGTLRFLALTTLLHDPQAPRLLCLEEPENGIHPERITAMLSLLNAYAVDVSRPVDTDNPLRQVVINTHSPEVVQEVDENDLLGIASREVVLPSGSRTTQAVLSPLSGTWRAKSAPGETLSRSALLGYLQPSRSASSPEKTKRVRDREDVRQMLLPLEP